MNGLVALGGVVAILLSVGAAVGLADRRNFAPRWLAIAAMLVAANDAGLTQVYGSLPDLFGGERNWQGKLLALAVTLLVAASPVFGWRRCGLTLRQRRGGMRAALAVAAGYCTFFLLVAQAFPSGPASGEDIAFQLTLPGLEEELFYRGLLLFALDRAFTRRLRLLGVEWGWGAVLSCTMFGLAHAFGFAHGRFALDPVVMALTALPAFVAIWLRLRTASVVLPVLLHNFGNTAFLIAPRVAL